MAVSDPVYNRDYDPRLAQAIDEIYGDYGVRVSVSTKRKSLRKWGYRAVAGTGTEVVSTLVGSETTIPSITTNGVTTVISTSTSDTQNIKFYEGHSVSGTDLTFRKYSTEFALMGRTPVTLPLALRDVTRARLSAPANGTIAFYEGGDTTNGDPDDDTEIHLIIPPGDIQSQKGQTSLSSTDYWIVTGVTGSVLSKTAAWAQFRLEVKPFTDAYFYPIMQWFGVKDSSGTVQGIGPSDPYAIVPANHDVRIVTQANTAGVVVAAGFQGFLAEVIG